MREKRRSRQRECVTTVGRFFFYGTMSRKKEREEDPPYDPYTRIEIDLLYVSSFYRPPTNPWYYLQYTRPITIERPQSMLRPARLDTHAHTPLNQTHAAHTDTHRQRARAAIVGGRVVMDSTDEDLDALLDDAADEVMQGQQQQQSEEDLLEAAAADVLSSSSMLPVPSRQQGGETQSTKAPPPTLAEALRAVLPAEEAAKWVPVVEADAGAAQEGCGYKPPSYAYRAFTEGGGGRGKKRPVGEAAGEGGDGEEEGGGAGASDKQEAVGGVLPELILRAGAAAGVRDTEGLRAGLKAHPAATERLQRLFVAQMAKDLKQYVEEDEDFDARRFPATAAKILGRTSSS
jgi:hypothetical protein